jgi:rusticyanin
MKDSSVVILAVGLGAMFALSLSIPIILSGHSGWIGGRGGPSFGGVSMMGVQGQTVTIDGAIQMMKNVPGYASLISSNNTIAFTSTDIRLVVLATDHEGALNLTGRLPPSYSTDDAFVIYGLVDPTLVIPHGAMVHVTVVNLDKDMYHNFVITTLSPPYSYMTMQGMMMNSQRQGFVQMMPFLPAASYPQGVAHEYSYNATLGTQSSLWYLCTYPGHAQTGMYGEVLVN